jgi:hypothetical protein
MTAPTPADGRGHGIPDARGGSASVPVSRAHVSCPERESFEGLFCLCPHEFVLCRHEEHFDKLFNINVREHCSRCKRPYRCLRMVALSFSTALSRVLRVLPPSASMPRVGRHPLFRANLDYRSEGPSYPLNVVSPGPINTPLTGQQSPEVIARIVSTVPMGRMREPDEVGRRRCSWLRMTPVS